MDIFHKYKGEMRLEIYLRHYEAICNTYLWKHIVSLKSFHKTLCKVQYDKEEMLM